MVKVPWIVKQIFNDLVWKIPTKEKILYLTFDDGPHPTATPFVLEELKKYNARATFFCLGKNVAAHPHIYASIMQAGHTVGNHTFNHLNGWKVKDKQFFQDVIEAKKYIDPSLFRPPYGKITPFQAKHLKESPLSFDIIMWDVLSKDYDVTLTARDCSFNVVRHAQPGSIVVFHDSEKAWPRMQGALTETLKYFAENGWTFAELAEKNVKEK